MPLLASVEGASDVEWPPSPPLQSVEPGPPDENRQIMCVGMAGRGHWSAGVELDASSQSTVFDIACRVKQAPPPGAGNALGSLYRTMTAPVIEAAKTLRVETDGAGLRIESLQPSPDTPAAEIDVTESGVQISPSTQIGETPYTVRWRYRVSVV